MAKPNDEQHTISSPRQKSVVITLFLLVVGGGALFVPFGAVTTARSSGEVDTTLEEEHPWRHLAVTAITAFRVRLFGEAQPGVRIGSEGWLFTDEEFAHHPDDPERRTASIDAIRTASRTLESRGVSLVVVLVPSKARVVAHRLRAVEERLISAQNHLDVAAAELAASGITIVRADRFLTDDHFFAQDTHWRPAGAVATAEAVVAHLIARWGNERVASLSDGEYELVRDAPTTLSGDLHAFVPLGALAPLFGRSPALREERYIPIRSIGEPARGLGLFDTPAIPIALVGTSYSADARFGFEAALRAAFSADVLNVSAPAGGPFEPMATYLSSNALIEAPPQIVIWEIPERYLTLPDISRAITP